MKFPDWLPVYGDTSYRGPCPQENAEQVTLMAEIRRRWPDTLGKIALHPANEGKRTYGQAAWAKAGGMTKGASDLIIPTGLVVELKRLDHTQSKWQEGQLDYLLAAKEQGAFVAVALGHAAALEAIYAWISSRT